MLGQAGHKVVECGVSEPPRALIRLQSLRGARSTHSKLSPEMGERALRMEPEDRGEYPSSWVTIKYSNV